MSYTVQRAKPFFEIDGEKRDTMEDIFSFLATDENGNFFVGVWSSVQDCFIVAPQGLGKEDHAGIDIFCVGENLNYAECTIENIEKQMEDNLLDKISIFEVSTGASLFYDYLKR